MWPSPHPILHIIIYMKYCVSIKISLLLYNVIFSSLQLTPSGVFINNCEWRHQCHFSEVHWTPPPPPFPNPGSAPGSPIVFAISRTVSRIYTNAYKLSILCDRRLDWIPQPLVLMLILFMNTPVRHKRMFGCTGHTSHLRLYVTYSNRYVYLGMLILRTSIYNDRSKRPNAVACALATARS